MTHSLVMWLWQKVPRIICTLWYWRDNVTAMSHIVLVQWSVVSAAWAEQGKGTGVGEGWRGESDDTKTRIMLLKSLVAVGSRVVWFNYESLWLFVVCIILSQECTMQPHSSNLQTPCIVSIYSLLSIHIEVSCDRASWVGHAVSDISHIWWHLLYISKAFSLSSVKSLAWLTKSHLCG